MYNWSINTARLKKKPKEFKRFVLEQKINFGLNNSKLSKEKLKKYWSQLNIDPAKKNYLKTILWPQS